MQRTKPRPTIHKIDRNFSISFTNIMRLRSNDPTIQRLYYTLKRSNLTPGSYLKLCSVQIYSNSVLHNPGILTLTHKGGPSKYTRQYAWGLYQGLVTETQNLIHALYERGPPSFRACPTFIVPRMKVQWLKV